MFLQNSTVRGILGIVAGLLMIIITQSPDRFISYLVILTGAFFIILGIYAIILYFLKKENYTFVYPVIATASIILGTCLVIATFFIDISFFTIILMYICGGLFVLAGVQQIAVLIAARRWSKFHYCFYVLPALIAVTGIILYIAGTLILERFGTAFLLYILGITSLLYGINELIGKYKFRKPKTPETEPANDDEPIELIV